MQALSNKKLENKHALNFTQLWLRHSVYWPYFLILLLLSVGAAWLYLLYTPPQYQANARVLIKDENKGADDRSVEFLTMVSTKKLLENEKEVFLSKRILVEVVKNLGLYAPIYEKGKFRDVSAYTSSPVRIEAQNQTVIGSPETYSFTYNANDNTVQFNQKVFALNQWIVLNRVDTIRFVKNPDFSYSTASKYDFQLVDPDAVAEMVKNSVFIEPSSKASTILDIYCADDVPERAEDILNELIEAYNKTSLNDKNILATNTLKFVQERLDQVGKNLDAVENKIKQYKSSSGAVDIGTQSQLFLQNVSSNDQKLSEINMKLAVLDKVEEYVVSKDAKDGIVPSTLGVDDPMLGKLLGNLYDAELEYEKYRKTEGENSPALTAINMQIDKIRPSIIENIRSQRTSLETSKNNLVKTNNLYNSSLVNIPTQEKELVNINREQSTITSIYSFLLQKKEEAVLSKASTIPSSIVVDRAKASYSPVSPKPMKIYMIAFIAPFIIGIGTITIKETLNSKVLFRQEIEDLTVYPIIGEIASDKTKSPIAVNANARTFISEQFRQLRVAISLNSNKNKCNRILVTSTISGEGKSYIAVNLATSFAINNKKTVLLELDLNNPTVYEPASISNSPGISEYLQGKAEKEEIIKRTNLQENLFIVPAGKCPEWHPSELLENGKVQEFINYLSELFDYIIIDTAPVGAITDAFILSHSCHMTLYVVRHNYTPKIYLERLDQNNATNKLNNISIVFNGIRPRGFGKHHYGYGYGYGYVYNVRKKDLDHA